MRHSLEIADAEVFEETKPSFVRQVVRIFLILVAIVIGIILLLVLIAVCRTLSLKEVIRVDGYPDLEISLPDDRIRSLTSVFAESLRFKTISRGPHDYDREELQKLQDFLILKFPSVFNSSFITWERVNTLSLLFTVKGSDSSLAPYMLASHLDVVPVQEELWTHNPFLGRIIHDPVTQQEVIWGRGAIDDKSGVIGILSAIELLLETNWKPTRSFYVAFGHDEEVSGLDGARSIGKLLQERNVNVDFLIDEGMPVTIGVMPGIDVPVALIGVTEKGWMNVKVETEGTGGHSSIPPKDQAVNRLAKAIHNLHQFPQPSMFGRGPESDMLAYAAPKANWPYNLMYANQWLFGSVLSLALTQTRESNALLRTTTAVTKFSGGIKDNIIPSKTWALVNHRVHPGQSLKGVLDYDRTAIGDPKVKVEMVEGEEAHPVSPYGPDSTAFTLIASAINYVHPDAVTVPGIMVANTDSRHYVNITKQIYRMYPFIVDKDQIAKIHSKDELLSVDGFKAAIKFYQVIIRASDSSGFVASLDDSYSPPSNPSEEFEADPVFFKE